MSYKSNYTGEQIDEAVRQVLENGGGIVEEADPTVPQHVKNIQTTDIEAWNNKSNFSGSYNDLTDKPEIPVYTAGENITIENGVISSTGRGEISNSPTTVTPIYNLWTGSQEQYEAITPKEENTLYFIPEE